tara:strand:- start:68 stop:805 length:738 start_codon:yes stop_codon:yes gene_type:complete
MKFRPFFWLTLTTLPTLAVLIGLGTWQLQRLQWKNNLIELFEARISAPEITVPDTNVILDDVRYRRLDIEGKFFHKKEIFLTGRTYEGNAGFHVVTPLELEDGRIILINRGWVSEDYRNPQKRLFSLHPEKVDVDAILRQPRKKGFFVPDNEPQNGFWFTLVPSEINEHLGLGPRAISSFYADAVRTSEVLTLPIGAKTKLNLRNAHLGYAITWYGIALALLGVYFVFHYQAGRVKFGRQSGNQR